MKQTPIQVPRIGSKDWLWTCEKLDDGDYSDLKYILDTDWGTYEIQVECGTATVTDDTDGMDIKIATFDLFRFGSYVDGDGTRLSRKQAMKGIRLAQRFCEMDARRKAREDGTRRI